MSDFQTIADRVEIGALRGEFTDAVMMRDYDRLASLFTLDGALRMPNIPVELLGQEEIRAWGRRVPDLVEFLVQNTHPGTIALDGDTASGRAYMSELGRTRDGRQGLNYAVYHDRYQRTGDGWKFSERVYAAPTPRSARPTSGAATAATDSTTAPGSPCAPTSRPACGFPAPPVCSTQGPGKVKICPVPTRAALAWSQVAGSWRVASHQRAGDQFG